MPVLTTAVKPMDAVHRGQQVGEEPIAPTSRPLCDWSMHASITQIAELYNGTQRAISRRLESKALHLY